MQRAPNSNRERERGQTILLVAFSMLAMLAFAAIAIDVVTLYVAHGEAQRAADAAALSGAKVFVTSGYTTNPSAFSTSSVCADAQAQAQSTLALNSVSGSTPSLISPVSSSCDVTTNPKNPRLTVQVQQTGLPTFFARIWTRAASSVSATATAEAYNPSGTGGNAGPFPIQVGGVKPFLLPNCTPTTGTTANPNCGAGGFFIDPTNGNVVGGGAFIGSTLTLILPGQPGSLTTTDQGGPGLSAGQTWFYPLDIPINPPSAAPPSPASCPSASRTSCSLVGNGIFFDNIACFNPFQFSCGQVVGGMTAGGGAPLIPVDTRLAQGGSNWGQLQSRVDQGTQCLIHTSGKNDFTGTCQPGVFQQDCFTPQGAGQPILISPGKNNPDSSLSSATYISRSDSVITVPLFDGRNLCFGATNGSPACNFTAPVVGFLQLGVVQDAPASNNGSLQTIILNASGCSPSLTGASPISGGDVSPIPVRLVTPPPADNGG